VSWEPSPKPASSYENRLWSIWTEVGQIESWAAIDEAMELDAVFVSSGYPLWLLLRYAGSGVRINGKDMSDAYLEIA
jgi:hypothetical protein